MKQRAPFEFEVGELLKGRPIAGILNAGSVQVLDRKVSPWTGRSLYRISCYANGGLMDVWRPESAMWRPMPRRRYGIVLP